MLFINDQYTGGGDLTKTISPSLTPSTRSIVLPGMRGYAADRFTMMAAVNSSNKIQITIYSANSYNLSTSATYLEYLLIDHP